ncbi:MAG: hypothetical protein K6A92_09880 [Lachnospiraceae bacterium]|nr:hypothetical protein [Lachnospiraceae bacterium]
MSKIKLWTSWNFIRSQLVTRLRQFFTKLFDVKPKDPDDYYTVFGWMISKKLAYSIVIFLGVISVWYIFSVRNAFQSFGSEDTLRTYKYNSIQLRMAKDKVRILGKSGYLAYEGNVADGYVAGEGTLYDPSGAIVYRGKFEKNNYEGEGKLFYSNGTLNYEGSFHENLYDGTGMLYRENGTLYYEGGFTAGLKNGEGKLCAENGKVIFDGLFANDEIVYSAFLGKSTEEVGAMYSGSRRIWNNDDEYCVYMSDIGALYFGAQDAEALNDDVMVSGIYVLSDSFFLGKEYVSSLSELSSALGEPVYEGNSDVLFSEAVVINILNETGAALSGPVFMEVTAPYSDVTVVEDYDQDYVLYLTAYKVGDITYTFYSKEKNGAFSFYSISGAVEDNE